MKVTGARVYLVNVGSLHPVLVEVLPDEGISGVGDAAVAYGELHQKRRFMRASGRKID